MISSGVVTYPQSSLLFPTGCLEYLRWTICWSPGEGWMRCYEHERHIGWPAVEMRLFIRDGMGGIPYRPHEE
jgi:hypothetical protein